MSKVQTKSKVSKYFYDSKEAVIITSDIWDRDEEYKRLFPKYIPHVGYDYKAFTGTKLVACFDGEVVNVVTELNKSTYGRQVFLYSPTLNVTAHYAHLKSVNVKTGDKVKQGTLVGLSGRSGLEENTYDAHLHFGVAKGKIVNAGYKGNYLGDAWVDVELFDFEGKPKPAPTTTIKVGQKVRIESSATKYATGENIPTWVKAKTHTVSQIKNDRALLKEINSWVLISDIEGQSSGSTTSTPKPTEPVKPVSNVGKNWTPKKVPLTLYDKNGKAYQGKSNNKRTYRILEETTTMFKIENDLFDPKQVWVKKGEGTVQ